jgi:hypothetical protein
VPKAAPAEHKPESKTYGSNEEVKPAPAMPEVHEPGAGRPADHCAVPGGPGRCVQVGGRAGLGGDNSANHRPAHRSNLRDSDQ